MAERQYLGCEYRPGGRLYTYHYDHDGTAPAAVGDRVKIADAEDPSAWKYVRVAALVERPAYATKPVLELAGSVKTQLKLSLGGKPS